MREHSTAPDERIGKSVHVRIGSETLKSTARVLLNVIGRVNKRKNNFAGRFSVRLDTGINSAPKARGESKFGVIEWIRV